MSRPRRLLTLGHSYVVGVNRRLAHELAVAGAGEWEVTAAAPETFHGDFGPLRLEGVPGERCRLVGLPARLTRRAHLMLYGRALRGLLREGWDVVHCWGEPFVLSAAQVARWTPPDSKLVFATFQNLPKRYPPPFAQVERYALRRADGWIAFGRTVEEALRGRPGYADRPHRVIPPGVDTGRFRPDPEAGRRVRWELGWGDDDGRPVVGYLGRFVPQKGLGMLMRVLDRLSTPWRALFVGGGEMDAEIRAWGAKHGDGVRVMNGVPHDGVPAYLGAMDVLCAPSQTTPRWREQLGRMLVEAMACGAPVLASDSGEIPHVVAGAGVIAPEADEAVWTRELEALLRDPARRADLSRRGVERARAEFALPVVARRHLEFFAELAGSPRGSPCLS